MSSVKTVAHYVHVDRPRKFLFLNTEGKDDLLSSFTKAMLVQTLADRVWPKLQWHSFMCKCVYIYMYYNYQT